MNLREVSIVLRNLVLGTNIDSLRMVREPQKFVSSISEGLFLRRLVHPKGDLAQAPVWHSLGVEGPVEITIDPNVADSEWLRSIPSYTADLVALCMLCRFLNPQTIFEIGTYQGRGALHWAMNAPRARVYTLDLPPGEAPSLAHTVVDRYHVANRLPDFELAFRGTPQASRITSLHGDSAKFDFSPYYKQIDLFFVDGAHSYEYVKSDTGHAFDCCHMGSVIAWHDYGRVGFNGVSRFLHELRDSGYDVRRVPGGSLAYLAVK